jgi:hypothetical protein
VVPELLTRLAQGRLDPDRRDALDLRVDGEQLAHTLALDQAVLFQTTGIGMSAPV